MKDDNTDQFLIPPLYKLYRFGRMWLSNLGVKGVERKCTRYSGSEIGSGSITVPTESFWRKRSPHYVSLYVEQTNGPYRICPPQWQPILSAVSFLSGSIKERITNFTNYKSATSFPGSFISRPGKWKSLGTRLTSQLGSIQNKINECI